MEPTVVASGEEALQRLDADDNYDVALLDVQMPGIDGLTLATKIRERVNGYEFPIVMLSSIHQHAPSDLPEHTTWLHKPVKQSNLHDVLTESLQENASSPLAPAQSDGASASTSPPNRVLLAEDDAVNRTMTTQLLDKMGHETHTVTDGREALAAVREQTYDVVLMDVQMPEMDGLEATRRLREEHPPGEQPHVVALTASVMKEDRKRCREAGMEAFLSKPIQRDDLADILEAAPHLSDERHPSVSPADGTVEDA
jgi:CheY-like chemotaxis protein